MVGGVIYRGYKIGSSGYKGFVSRTICSIKSSIVDAFGVG
jgi:hypothetical protein